MSNLTLSDREQRELYEAAQIIQKAYRSYKGRKGFRPGKGSSMQAPTGSQGHCGHSSAMRQEKEAKAAVVIQNYYRRWVGCVIFTLNGHRLVT